MASLVPIKAAFALAAPLALAACGPADAPQETAASQSPEPSEPPATGRPAAFTQCATCHAVEAGKNSLGPTLSDVVGRKAASVPGFAYSSAMRESNLTWDETTLDRFLAKPRDLVPGTKMSFAGMPDPAKRAQIVAYLATLK